MPDSIDLVRLPVVLAAAVMLSVALTLVACGRGSPSNPPEPHAVSPAAFQTQPPAQSAPPSTTPPQELSDIPMVSVRVFNSAGELVGPVNSPRVIKTDEQWRAQLTNDQFRVARDKGTERPFCGTLLDNHLDGVYTCICCGLPLFASSSKFNSGTGWPSFFQPVAKENVIEHEDNSVGMTRVEILCARCDCHLGHVFEDGPKPTGLRFCVNSESLSFTSIEDVKKLADPAADAKAQAATGGKSAAATSQPALAEAVFAGGCFWCVEAVFEELDGVKEAVSGYAGGTKEAANYEAVCTGKTGHAEAVKIIYDPAKISYEELLKVHFATHDPTSLNRQGADAGTQYRSAIFYENDEQKKIAQAFIADVSEAKVYDKKIVTTLEPLKPDAFYPAETYHQNYVCQNLNSGYVRSVALPKVEKVRKQFKDSLKTKSPIPE